ncbi:hypothetical protein B0H14DRAFT_2706336 [Mycena olivaceomarginata]|nr:hypothetical protein B0H14DRAFT_2706336 [Mycena olivaceomarginata]
MNLLRSLLHHEVVTSTQPILISLLFNSLLLLQCFIAPCCIVGQEAGVLDVVFIGGRSLSTFPLHAPFLSLALARAPCGVRVIGATTSNLSSSLVSF